MRATVVRFGDALKRVSLLAPDTILRREIEAAYAPLVTADLLAAWAATPGTAPGRSVSSPWPDRVDIDSVTPAGRARCVVHGHVVFVSSAPTGGGSRAALREPVTVTVMAARDDEWRVSAYQQAGSPRSTAGEQPDGVEGPDAPEGPDGPDAAAAVIRSYYAAIDARDFERAYGIWEGEGAASGQTFEAFAAGFAETADVRVEVGAAGRLEGAAGSRYVRVPVTIHATTTDGVAQRFRGTYTLRRSVVDGATPAQRRWRIHSADIRAEPR